MESFAALREWISELPDQVDGDAAAICQTGEQYVEFHAHSLSRPKDIEIIERDVATKMQSQLERYFAERAGTIYWRIPFESEVRSADVVSHYDENGPDIDFMTRARCIKNPDWVRVSCYCRLYRATYKTIERPKDKAAA